jgi:hypothetical protein
MELKAMANQSIGTLGPANATSASANTREGNAMIPSMIRCTTASRLPPK